MPRLWPRVDKCVKFTNRVSRHENSVDYLVSSTVSCPYGIYVFFVCSNVIFLVHRN